jgi:hypothetical protein
MAKPNIGILLGMGKPKEKEDDRGDGVGQEVLDAIAAKDPVALEAALQDAYRQFGEPEEEEEPEMSEEEEEE